MYLQGVESVKKLQQAGWVGLRHSSSDGAGASIGPVTQTLSKPRWHDNHEDASRHLY
jgi:hypothetical protein